MEFFSEEGKLMMVVFDKWEDRVREVAVSLEVRQLLERENVQFVEDIAALDREFEKVHSYVFAKKYGFEKVEDFSIAWMSMANDLHINCY